MTTLTSIQESQFTKDRNLEKIPQDMEWVHLGNWNFRLTQKHVQHRKSNMEPWIETYTGKHFNFLSPSKEDINIIDIAHSLSMQCRYTGHCKHFYSVAEHSIAVADYLLKTYGDRKLTLAGLLHDSAEAYLSDLASPLKGHIGGYEEITKSVEKVIAEVFDVNFDDPRIKEADIALLSQEALQLLPSRGDSWNWDHWGGRPEFVEPIVCLAPNVAKGLFMAWFKQLTAEPEILFAV